MKRSYRTGAAAVATAAMLTGAGVALASLRDTPAPAKVSTVTPEGAPTSSDQEDLDASVSDLRSEAKELKADIAAREKAAAADAGQRSDDDEADATGKVSHATPAAPATDATTGASGAGGTNDEYEEHEDSDDD